METKQSLHNRPHACFNRALPDEPMFILLGRDPDAPAAIVQWARERELRINREGREPTKDELDQIMASADDAKAFIQWRAENEGKWRDAKATPFEHPSEQASSLAGRVLSMGEPESEEEAAELYTIAKSLAGAVLRLDPQAGQSRDGD